MFCFSHLFSIDVDIIENHMNPLYVIVIEPRSLLFFVENILSSRKIRIKIVEV